MLKKWRNMPVMVKASATYTICSILQKCLSFITLPLFTRLMTTEQYGQYTVYASWSSILTIFITLYLAYGCFNTAMVRFEDDRDSYIASVQGLCTVLAGAFLVIYLPLRHYWNQIFELPTEMVLLMVAEVVGMFALSCWYGKLRFVYKYKQVALLTLLISVISPLIAYFLVMAGPEKGYARIIGYAAVTIAFGGALYVWNLYRGKTFYHEKYWRYALSFHVPLIPYYLSQVVFNQSDRIMISHYCGKEKAAIYGVACSLALVLTFVLNAINDAYVPWIFKKLKTGETKENHKIANMLALLMAVLLLGVIALAPEIILVLAGKQYWEACFAVAPVAMSMLLLFYAQLFINIQFYYEEKGKLVYASVGAAVLNVVLNALLIPKMGYIAAAYTTLFSYLVFAGANYVAMRLTMKKWEFREKLFDSRGLLLILAAFCALSFVAVALYGYREVRLILSGISLVILFLNGKRILGLVNTIRSKDT